MTDYSTYKRAAPESHRLRALHSCPAFDFGSSGGARRHRSGWRLAQPRRLPPNRSRNSPDRPALLYSLRLSLRRTRRRDDRLRERERRFKWLEQNPGTLSAVSQTKELATEDLLAGSSSRESTAISRLIIGFDCVGLPSLLAFVVALTPGYRALGAGRALNFAAVSDRQ
jgi:hypothetical protein